MVLTVTAPEVSSVNVRVLVALVTRKDHKPLVCCELPAMVSTPLITTQ